MESATDRFFEDDYLEQFLSNPSCSGGMSQKKMHLENPWKVCDGMTHCHSRNDEDCSTHISKGYQVQK